MSIFYVDLSVFNDAFIYTEHHEIVRFHFSLLFLWFQSYFRLSSRCLSFFCFISTAERLSPYNDMIGNSTLHWYLSFFFLAEAIEWSKNCLSAIWNYWWVLAWTLFKKCKSRMQIGQRLASNLRQTPFSNVRNIVRQYWRYIPLWCRLQHSEFLRIEKGTKISLETELMHTIWGLLSDWPLCEFKTTSIHRKMTISSCSKQCIVFFSSTIPYLNIVGYWNKANWQKELRVTDTMSVHVQPCWILCIVEFRSLYAE